MRPAHVKVLAMVGLLMAGIGGCAENGPRVTATPPQAKLDPAQVFNCSGDSREPHAWYVGPYKGFDNNLGPFDFARDFYCADQFKSRFFPKGFVTVFGSSNL